MSITTSIDRSGKCVYTVVVGELTFEKLIDSVSALMGNPVFNPDFDHLMDLSGVDKFNLTTAEIIRFAGRGIFSENSRRAVVAPSEEAFGISNVYTMFRNVSPDVMKIFRSVDEAREWLDERSNHNPPDNSKSE